MTSSSEIDMRYMRSLEEAVDECELNELIASLVVKNDHLVMWDDGTPANTSIELIMLQWAFDDLWLCCAHEYLQKDVDFEYHYRVLHRGEGSSHTNAGLL